MPIKINWYHKEINKPYEADGRVYISIYGETDDRSLPPADYNTAVTQTEAFYRICSFYGKNYGIYSEDEIDSFMAPEEHRFSARPRLKVLLLYSISLTDLESLPNLTAEDLLAASVTQSQQYSLATLTIRLKAVEQLFHTYYNQIKYFNGRIAPHVDFQTEYSRLALFQTRLESFLVHNGYEPRSLDVKEGSLVIGYDDDYAILTIQLIQATGKTKYLTKGIDYYFDKLNGSYSIRTNQLFFNLEKIYARRRHSIEWDAFIKRYLSASRIKVNYFGRPRTEDEAARLAREQDEKNKVLVPVEDAEEEDAVLKNPTILSKIIQEETAKIEENISDDLEQIAKELREVNEKTKIVRKFMNKYGLNKLVEAALECLMFKLPFPIEMLASMPPLPGVSPFDPPTKPIWPKLPKIPDKLPIIGIWKTLTDQIKVSLKIAAEVMLKQLVLTIANLIVELCKNNFEDEGPGTPIPELVRNHPNPRDYGKDPGLAHCMQDYNIESSVGIEFLTELAQNISNKETCDLLNGVPSVQVLAVINSILDETEKFAPIRVSLPDNETIIGFFVCLGELINPEWCANIQTPGPFVVPEGLEVCDIEAAPNEVLQELIDFYNELLDGIEQQQINSGLCGGVIPPLAQMNPFMHSMVTLMDMIFEVPKTTFVSELAGLREYYLVPDLSGISDPLLREVARREIKDENAPDDEGESEFENDTERKFVGSLLGESAFAGNDEISKARNVTQAIEDDRAARAMAAVKYDVAPAYKRAFEFIEDKITTDYRKGESLTAAKSKFNFSIAASGYTTTFNVVGAGSSKGAVTVYDENGDVIFDALPPGFATTRALRKVSTSRAGNSTAGDTSLISLDTMTNAFFSNTFDNAYLTGKGSSRVAFSESGALDALRDSCTANLYFPAYLSILNSMALNVNKSKYFNSDTMRQLLLLPVPCPEGRVIDGTDLLDIAGIKDEAMKEFVENACADIPCIVGPVEDAVIYGVANGYVQTELLEQVLKNLFFLDTYGFSGYVASPSVKAFLKDNIRKTIAREGIYSGAGSSDSRNQIYRALLKSSALYVHKLIASEGSSHSIPDPFNSTNQIILPAAAREGYETYLNTNKVLDPFGEFAFEYLIEKRIADTVPTMQQVFGYPDMTFGSSVLLNGLSHVDILDSVGYINTPAGSTAYTLDLKRANDLGDRDVRFYSLKGPEPPPDPDDSADSHFNAGLEEIQELLDNFGVDLGVDRGPAGPEEVFLRSLGFTSDEGTFAAENGAFGVEKYVKFMLDKDYLARLEEHAKVDMITSIFFDMVKNYLVGDLITETEADADTNVYTISFERFNAFISSFKHDSDKIALIAENAESLKDIFSNIDLYFSWRIKVPTGDWELVAVDDEAEEGIYNMYSNNEARTNLMDPRGNELIEPGFLYIQRIGARDVVDYNESIAAGENRDEGSYLEAVAHGGTLQVVKVPFEWKTIALKTKMSEGLYDLVRLWMNKIQRPVNPGTNIAEATLDPATGGDQYFGVKRTSFDELGSELPFGQPTFGNSVEPIKLPMGAIGAENNLQARASVGTKSDPTSFSPEYHWALNNNLANGYTSCEYFFTPSQIKKWDGDDLEDNEKPRRYRRLQSFGRAATAPADDDIEGTGYKWWNAQKANNGNTIYTSFGGKTERAELGLDEHVSGVGGGDVDTRSGDWRYASRVWGRGDFDDGREGTVQYREPLGEDGRPPSIYARMLPRRVDFQKHNGPGEERDNDWVDPAADDIFGPAELPEDPTEKGPGAPWFERIYQYAQFNVLGPNTGTPHLNPMNSPQGGDDDSDRDTLLGMWAARIYLTRANQVPLSLLKRLGDIYKDAFGGTPADHYDDMDYYDRSDAGYSNDMAYSKFHPSCLLKVVGATAVGGSHPDYTLSGVHSYAGALLSGDEVTGPSGLSIANNLPEIDCIYSPQYLAVEALQPMSLDFYMDYFESFSGGNDSFYTYTETGTKFDPTAKRDTTGTFPRRTGMKTTPSYSTGLTEFDQALDNLVKDIKVGSRLVYYTPPLKEGTETGPLLQTLTDLIKEKTLSEQDVNFYKNRSNYFVKVPGGDGYIYHLPTKVKEEKIVMSTLRDASFDALDFVNTEVDPEEPIYDVIGHYFNQQKRRMFNAMVTSAQYKSLFETAINMEELGAFLFLYGLFLPGGGTRHKQQSMGGGPKEVNLFSDTQGLLRVALKAALAGNAYDYKDPEGQSASEVARDRAMNILGDAAAPLANLGASFILKMLIETPKEILKGLAELIDPHVVLGTQIRNITGEAFSDIGADAFIPIVDHFYEKMKAELPAIPEPLWPKISEKGIDLIGTLPYTFVLPPTPLGLAYIFFNLSEEDWMALLGLENRQIECDDANTSSGTGEYSDAYTTKELPENPSTTFGCPEKTNSEEEEE